jgi:hypothetical protein
LQSFQEVSEGAPAGITEGTEATEDSKEVRLKKMLRFSHLPIKSSVYLCALCGLYDPGRSPKTSESYYPPDTRTSLNMMLGI